MSSQTWNFPAIQAASGALHNSATKITGELDDVEKTLMTLADIWGGPSATEFQNTLRTWKNDSRELNDALGNLSGAVSQASDSMQQTDRGIEASFA